MNEDVMTIDPLPVQVRWSWWIFANKDNAFLRPDEIPFELL
jgi:hypothetical protein